MWIIFVVFVGILVALINLSDKIQSVQLETPAQAQTPETSVPNFDHIILVVMENKSYDDIVGNQDDAPFLNMLIKSGGLATNYSAVAHPSLPNYIALIGGDTFGITSDCTNCFVKSKNLIDNLATAGKTWKAYMEDQPTPCFVGNKDNYAQKHNPFIYFDDIRKNPERCKNIVPLTQLATDLKNGDIPNLIWITPNLCNDMHNCSVSTGDKWLSKNLTQIINTPSIAKSNYLLIITWDEADLSEGNRVTTILYGPQVKKDFSSDATFDHYSVLSTIEKSWDLSPLTTNDKNASSLSVFFKN